MWAWLRRRRRLSITARSVPARWLAILDENARFWHGLAETQQQQLLRAVQIIVAEKNWEGCGGLVLHDEHRVTIAAHMARMVLNFREDYFDEVKSVLVYPAAYRAKSQRPLSGGLVIEGTDGRLGEAWHRGPVVLSWADVLHDVRDPWPVRNVVIHEFAHQLDMRNGGAADGFPTLENASLARRWSQVLPAAFQELQELCSQHVPTVLDCYGASSPAEFFAVASESYFVQSDALATHWPDVYQLLEQFYSGAA